MPRKTRLAGIAFLALFVSRLCAGEASQPLLQPNRISLAEYQQELSRVDHGLKDLVERPEGVEALRDSIPDKWPVQTSSGLFDIDNENLRYKLDLYSDHPDERGEILPELELRIETQLEGARDFEHPADTTARAKLQSVLQEREYRNVAKMQSPFEKMKDYAMSWLIRVLSKLFRSAAAHPRVSAILLWSLIGLITLAFVLWLSFLMRRTRREEFSYPHDGGALVPSHKPWQQWLREARASGELSNWREAIHLAYWGGISYLESSGAWKPDRARTPREYLRMLPDAGGRREPLESLTRQFELIWYAQQMASPGDFEFALTQLEKIGCR